ncbi:MAG: hypothetical protein ACI8ZV_002035 [Chitinophagales bacterium]|jgi:uncharacterized protein YbjT (DUF2867 family)
MHSNRVLLLGGSGFIGQQLAFSLANQGYLVTIPCRRPHRHRALSVHANIQVVESNVFDNTQLDQLCQNQNTVINLIGILHERKKGDFRKVHVDFIKTLVSTCTHNKIKRLLHLSALGADQARGTSLYLRSKGEGENLLHTFGQKDLHVTSFQPSVVFGLNDQFINQFAGILKLTIGFFPLACADSKFAPIYVGDLVTRIVNTIDDKATHGNRYPLCGPEVFTLKQILELIAKSMGISCRIVPLSNGLSKLQALVLQNLPGKLFTMDNYRSLQTPSVCDNSNHGTTSLTQYIQNISVLFNRNKHYDDFRQDHSFNHKADIKPKQ